jgi:hypothetical protein
VIEEVIKLLEYLEIPQDDDISIKDLLTARQCSRHTAPVTSASRAAGSQVGGEMTDDALDDALESNQPEEDTIHVVPKGYR